jgi:hypothetical protein
MLLAAVEVLACFNSSFAGNADITIAVTSVHAKVSVAPPDLAQAGLTGRPERTGGSDASAAAASFLPSAMNAAIAGRCRARGRTLPASH